MNSEKARVTLCLPVRNGQRSIRKALDSALSQDLRDLEVAISDSASDDETPDSPDPVRRLARMLWFFRSDDPLYDSRRAVLRREALDRSGSVLGSIVARAGLTPWQFARKSHGELLDGNSRRAS